MPQTFTTLSQRQALTLGQLPNEAFLKRAIPLSQFRRFGCPCWVHVPSQLRDKLAPKAQRARFLGFSAPLGSGIYKLRLENGQTTQSQTVVFDDHPEPPALTISPELPAADTPPTLPQWWPSDSEASSSQPPPSDHDCHDDDDSDDDDDDSPEPAAHDAPAPQLLRVDSTDSIESADEVPLRQMVAPPSPHPPAQDRPAAPLQTDSRRPRPHRSCAARRRARANAAVLPDDSRPHPALDRRPRPALDRRPHPVADRRSRQSAANDSYFRLRRLGLQQKGRRVREVGDGKRM